MTTIVTADDEVNLQKQFGRSSFYLSLLVPRTLWEARTSSEGRTLTEITFDQGSGLDWSAVEIGQTVWVGSAAYKKDIGIFRIRNVSSGDGGVTGTVTIPFHPLYIVDNYYLTFVHDYQYDSRYPWIEWDDKTFKKDHVISYTNQNLLANEPITPDIWFSQRAGTIRDGELVIWYDASPSKSWSGGTINSYGLTAYPTTGITIDHNSSTGKGKLVFTDTTIGYYWLKFTFADTNGNTRTTYRVVHAHSPYISDGTYPIAKFSVGNYTKDWSTGGVSANINFHGRIPDIIDDPDNKAPDDIIDLANAILWKEPREPLTTVRDDDLVLVDPQISHSPDTSDWSIDATFHAGVMISGQVAPDSTNVDLEITITGDPTTYTPTGVVADGMISVPVTFTAPDNSGTITVKTTTPVTVLEQPYAIGDYITRSSTYPSWWLLRAQNLLVGYLGEDTATQDSSVGAGNDVYTLMSIERVMAMHYMFSVSLAAIQSPAYWYETHSGLTNILGVLHLLEWHSNFFEVADFRDNTGNTDPRAYMEWSGQDIYTQADGMLLNTGIRAHLITDQDGRLHVTHNINWLPDDEKAGLPTVTELNRSYYGGQIQFTDRPMNQVALVYGDGFVWDGTYKTDEQTGETVPDLEGYCSIAAWFVPQRGGQNTRNIAAQTIRSQQHLDEITGQVWEDSNQPYTLSLTMKGDPVAVLNVHEQEYWEINVASGDNPKGLVLTDQLIILRTVSASIDVGAGVMTVSTNWEFNVSGLPGTAGICPDFMPTYYGYKPLIPSIAPGSIITGSDGGGVYLLPVDTSTWLHRTNAADENTNFLCLDPWWKLKQGTFQPSQAILWRCGNGIIERSLNAGDTWTDYTPAEDPPNDAGDSPAPTVANLEFRAMDASFVAIDAFAALATWTESGGERRSWLLYTLDDGITWLWYSVKLPPTIGSFDAAVDITVQAEDIVTQAPHQGENTQQRCDNLTSTKVVTVYGSTGGTVNEKGYARIIETSTSTVYSASKFTTFDSDFGEANVITLDVNHFLVAFTEYDDVTDNEFELWLRVGQESSGTITWGTPVQITNYTQLEDFHLARINSSYAVLTVADSVGTYTYTNILTISGGLTVTPAGVDYDYQTSGNVISAASYVLSSTRIMTVWNEYNPGGAGTRQIKSRIGNVSGVTTTYATTTHTVATDDSDSPAYLQGGTLSETSVLLSFVRYDGVDNEGRMIVGIANPDDTIDWGSEAQFYDDVFGYPTLDIIDQFTAAVVYMDGAVYGFYGKLITIVGDVPTAGDSSYFTPDDDDEEPQICVMNNGEFFVSFGTTDGVGDTYIRYTVGNFSYGYDFDATGIMLSRGTATRAWVTGCNDTNLYLIWFGFPIGFPVLGYNLGSCTYAQLDARTYAAYPLIQYGQDSKVVVNGRMAGPLGLANPSHVIYTDNGVDFSVAESGWGADLCSALIMNPSGDVFAIRGTPSSATLYTGTLAGGLTSEATSSLAYDVEHRAIDVDLRDETVVIASRGANSIMVQGIVVPYSAWIDITYNHQNSYGVRTINIL